MNSKAFTLVELIVVMGIIGVLLAIVSLNFNSWQRKSQIERQTRELYTDINTARTEAIFRKQIHRITFQPNSYVFKRYSTENESYSAGTTLFTKNVAYQMTLENGDSIADKALEFNMRGLTTGSNFSSFVLTLRLNPMETGASLDCIIVHIARINMGKMENGSCVSK